MPNEHKDPVKEARELLNDPRYQLMTHKTRKLIESLCDEVEQLRSENVIHRGLKTIGDEGARLFAEGELEELNEIRECDKCDLCEDHHD